MSLSCMYFNRMNAVTSADDGWSKIWNFYWFIVYFDLYFEIQQYIVIYFSYFSVPIVPNRLCQNLICEVILREDIQMKQNNSKAQNYLWKLKVIRMLTYSMNCLISRLVYKWLKINSTEKEKILVSQGFKWVTVY